MTEPRTRDTDVALIAEHLGIMPDTPSRRADALARAFSRFGWDMLTDEAVAFIADRMESDQRYSDRLDARNRALRDEGAAERALRKAQHETGDLLAEAFPIPSTLQQKDAA